MIRWSDAALTDLFRLRSGLGGDQAAKRVGRLIAESADCLDDFPGRGRDGVAPGTRELPLPGLPWRLVYRAGESGVMILRVI
ncbi:plasmid stabilization system [Paramagnetospirillum caucaseum]|uniref:Plasmid stabilization system n=1 Tax=Paramagnetospirillum caucaseum TaxID=1244869 RepID=M2Z2X8_9PROT|nr:type II toxin-antitoxin system RelE/ParE family toxin [Paramagnetospirillum caucaseum]EME68680.1 plasmid stabilization system [Paramagnetospirillum caucaseum]